MKKIAVLILSLIISTLAFADGPVTSQYMPNRIMRPSAPGFAAPDLRTFANIAASSTDAVLIAAVPGKTIRVLSLVGLTGAVATSITFNTKGAGAGVAITPAFQNGASGGEVMGFNPSGWFETNLGEGLTATTGAGSTTGILITYIAY